jgi:hypothetical protein
MEAFDHADVSLIDLLDFDGDAVPIRAGVEEIEGFQKPIVIIKANVGGSAPQTLPVAVESPEDPFKSGFPSSRRIWPERSQAYQATQPRNNCRGGFLRSSTHNPALGSFCCRGRTR